MHVKQISGCRGQNKGRQLKIKNSNFFLSKFTKLYTDKWKPMFNNPKIDLKGQENV